MSVVTVTLKFSNSEKVVTEATTTDTVLEFKNKISDKISIPAAQQRLIYKGRVLVDTKTLAEYGASRLRRVAACAPRFACVC